MTPYPLYPTVPDCQRPIMRKPGSIRASWSSSEPLRERESKRYKGSLCWSGSENCTLAAALRLKQRRATLEKLFLLFTSIHLMLLFATAPPCLSCLSLTVSFSLKSPFSSLAAFHFPLFFHFHFRFPLLSRYQCHRIFTLWNSLTFLANSLADIVSRERVREIESRGLSCLVCMSFFLLQIPSITWLRCHHRATARLRPGGCTALISP